MSAKGRDGGNRQKRTRGGRPKELGNYYRRVLYEPALAVGHHVVKLPSYKLVVHEDNPFTPEPCQLFPSLHNAVAV